MRSYWLFFPILGSFFIEAHACQVKDYECIKQQKIYEVRPNYNTDYLNNEKIIISGFYNKTPITIDARNGRQVLRNVNIISKNTKIYDSNSDSFASIVSIDNVSSGNSTVLDNIQLTTYGSNQIFGNPYDSDFSKCVSTFCLRTNDNNIEGVFKNINSGTLNIRNR